MTTCVFVNTHLEEYFARPPKERDVCLICYSELQKTEDLTYHVAHEAALHIFHIHCLRAWVRENPTCPSCRARITSINGVAVLPSPVDEDLPIDHRLNLRNAVQNGARAADAEANDARAFLERILAIHALIPRIFIPRAFDGRAIAILQAIAEAQEAAINARNALLRDPAAIDRENLRQISNRAWIATIHTRGATEAMQKLIQRSAKQFAATLILMLSLTVYFYGNGL